VDATKMQYKKLFTYFNSHDNCLKMKQLGKISKVLISTLQRI